MTYASSGQVDAQDYNDLINSQIGSSVYTLNDIFGLGNGDRGYGGGSINVSQAPDISEVVFGHDIESQEWKDLRNAFSDIALHQGTALPDGLPSSSLLDVGDIITYFSQLDSFANMNAIETNRLTANSSNLTVASKLTSTRTTSWTTMITHDFTVDFGDEDSARHFFNTGGQIRISASRTGGSASSQNTAWSTLTSTNSPYNFDYSDYYALTTNTLGTAGSLIRSVSSGGFYTSNMWIIYARATSIPGVRNARGSELEFRSAFVDGHTNMDFDMVDGTFTSTISERRSTGVFVRPSPTFTTDTPMTMGS